MIKYILLSCSAFIFGWCFYFLMIDLGSKKDKRNQELLEKLDNIKIAIDHTHESIKELYYLIEKKTKNKK